MMMALQIQYHFGYFELPIDYKHIDCSYAESMVVRYSILNYPSSLPGGSVGG